MPIGEGLGVIFESIRRRLSALVGHLQEAAGWGFGRMAFEFVQHKIDVRAVLLDGAGLHKAIHAQLAVVGLVAHAAQLGDV